MFGTPLVSHRLLISEGQELPYTRTAAGSATTARKQTVYVEVDVTAILLDQDEEVTGCHQPHQPTQHHCSSSMRKSEPVRWPIRHATQAQVYLGRVPYTNKNAASACSDHGQPGFTCAWRAANFLGQQQRLQQQPLQYYSNSDKRNAYSPDSTPNTADPQHKHHGVLAAQPTQQYINKRWICLLKESLR
jgi:hypothetical protein